MSTLTLARRIRDGATLPQRCDEHSSYVAGCAECKELARTRARARYQAATYGWLQPSHIPADEAREHVIGLRDRHNMSLSLIAEEAGVSFSTVRNIAEGVTRNSQPCTVYAVLAVRPTPAPLPNGLKLSIGSARRLQALAYAHYSSDDLAPMLGALPEVVRRWRGGKAPMISGEWHDAILALARTLDGTRGPSRRAHAYATRQGWVPLAAWDDVDDPDAEPFTDTDGDANVVDDIAIELALNGELVRLTNLEKRHAVHRGLAAGMTATAISKALRMSGANVHYLAGRPLPALELAAA